MRVKLRHRRLARELARSRMSLNRWAQRMGLSSGHLSDLVNGKRLYVTPETRQKLLDALGLSFDELFEIEHDKHRRLPAPAPPPHRRQGDAPMVHSLEELRYAVRSLTQRPAFTIAATLTIAVGIAANTTLFGFVNTVLLKPFPYNRPGELVSVFMTVERTGSLGNFSYPDFVDYRDNLEGTGLLDVAAHDWEPYAVSDGGRAVRVGGGRVSPNLFDLLGVQPIVGRTFVPEEGEPGAEPVVLLSEQLWTTHFGRDAEIVGRAIRVNGESRTVIGVMPASAAYPERARLWVTLADYPARDERGVHGLQATGRLASGYTPASASRTLRPLAEKLQEQYPEANEGRGVQLVGLRESLVGSMRPLSFTLLAVVAFVLLIVCANVANLLLAHGVSREREMAVRSALGASRGRLIRLLLTESALLAGIGCLAGFGLGYLGAHQLPRLIPVAIPAWVDLELDLNVALYTVGLAAIAAALFGLGPAISTAKPALVASLREGARSLAGGKGRLRAALVVAEVAISLSLLVGAGLMIQSLVRLSSVDPGFEAEGRLTVGIDLLSHANEEAQAYTTVFDGLLERMRAIPGVTAVAAIDRMPLKGSSNRVSFTAEGQSVEEHRRNPSALYSRVSRDYFTAMGIPMLYGDRFDEPLDRDQPRDAIVSRSLANRFWPEGEAIGKRLKLFGPDVDMPWMTVRAVVGDVRHYGLDEEASPALYVPYHQSPTTRLTWVLRTEREPGSLSGAVRQAVRDVDPNQPVHEVMTLGELVDRSYWQWRFFGVLFWIFAGLALLLAAVGIYGVMSYTVSERAHEVGLRMALGARPQEVLALVLRQGLVHVLLGLAAGTPLALALGRILSSALYDVSPFEVATFLGVAALLCAVGLAAILVPARRAASVDPLVALRHE